MAVVERTLIAVQYLYRCSLSGQSRGWGDLPQGTAVQWPVPNEEMDSRQQPFYNMGGLGNAGSAAKGTYGF